MTLEQIISELHYTNEVEKEVLRKIQRDKKHVDELARIAYQADNFDFPLCKRMPLTRLSGSSAGRAILPTGAYESASFSS